MKKEICKKISDFFGGNLREANGKLRMDHGMDTSAYDNEDQLLLDWVDTLVEHQQDIDNERRSKDLAPNRNWESEIVFIHDSASAKPEVFKGVRRSTPNSGTWQAYVDTKSTSTNPKGKNLHLGTYFSIVDAIYARKNFLAECESLLDKDDIPALTAKAKEYSLRAKAQRPSASCTASVPVQKGIIVTVIKNAENDEVWDDAFFYTGKAQKEKEVKAELTKAIKEYLISEDGDKALADACHDFNWSDGYAPTSILERYGFRRIYDGENYAIDNVSIIGSVVLCVSAYEFPEIEVTPVLWVKDVRGNMRKLFPEENDGCYDVDVRNQHISVDARNEAAAASLAELCPMDALFVEFDGNGVYHSVALPEKKPAGMTRDYYLLDFDHLG